MEIYDKAHELAGVIQDCEEYKALLAAGEKLNSDEKTKKLVVIFLMLQAQLAYAQSMGDKPVARKIELIGRQAELVKRNETAVEYLTHYNKQQVWPVKYFRLFKMQWQKGMSILD